MRKPRDFSRVKHLKLCIPSLCHQICYTLKLITKIDLKRPLINKHKRKEFEIAHVNCVYLSVKPCQKACSKCILLKVPLAQQALNIRKQACH